jgi:RND family efflux transporter MFP subunit
MLVGVAGCGASGGEEPTTSSNGAAAPDVVKIINVEVQDLTPSSFEEFIRLTGVVKAENDVVLSAEEPGRIERFFAEKGDAVRKGQRLVKIDDNLLRATLAEAVAESALAWEQYERQREVWEQHKIGTEIAYLERKRGAAQADARLLRLRERLENTTIHAPFDGVLEQRYIESSELAGMGTRIVRVLDRQNLKIVVGVPERYALDVGVGSRAHVVFDVLPGHDFEGVVRFAASAVNVDNRTFEVEIDLDNQQGIIKPEMIANVRIVRHAMDAVLIAPQEAVRRAEHGFVAYVATNSELGPVAEERRLVLGPSYANQVVVEKGLRAGDRLIVRGQSQVASGSRIHIVENERQGAQP